MRSLQKQREHNRAVCAVPRGIALALFYAVFALFITPLSTHTKEKQVVIVRQSSNESSERLIKGFKIYLSRQGIKPELSILTTSEIHLHDTQLTDSIRSLQPQLIVTIGSNLTRTISAAITDIPIVFGAVFQPEISGFVNSRQRPGSNVTGASLDIPPEIQFKYFKLVHPGLRRLGIIHSAEMNDLVKQAQQAAASAGIELFAIPVKKGVTGGIERAVYSALDTLLGQVDGLWSLSDPTVFSQTNTRMILTRTLRERVPFMGFSSTVVASGALFALDFDYKDIGRQVGRLSERVLRGESPSTLPVTRPGVIWLYYNENTARQVSIDIPEEFEAVAKKVYK